MRSFGAWLIGMSDAFPVDFNPDLDVVVAVTVSFLSVRPSGQLLQHATVSDDLAHGFGQPFHAGPRCTGLKL